MSANNTDDVLREVFIAGLRNAHAVEHQAMALLGRQIDRAKNYPEVEEKLISHRQETEVQIDRLEGVLRGLDEDPSALKDAAMTLSGNMAAVGHAFADDEVLKNAFANFAFENFEAACYHSLIVLAKRGGFSATLDPLQATLAEEESMADWVKTSLPDLTNKFVDLKAAGENASR